MARLYIPHSICSWHSCITFALLSPFPSAFALSLSILAALLSPFGRSNSFSLTVIYFSSNATLYFFCTFSDFASFLSLPIYLFIVAKFSLNSLPLLHLSLLVLLSTSFCLPATLCTICHLIQPCNISLCISCFALAVCSLLRSAPFTNPVFCSG